MDNYLMDNNILLNFIINIFGNYSILISFVAGLFGGELTIIALSFLALTKLIPISLWHIMIFTTLGLIISDLVLFLIGRTHYFSNLRQLEKFSPHFKKIDSFIVKWSRDNLFLVIICAKLIYGVSVPTLIYLGMKKFKVRIFLLYIITINIFFVIIFMIIGILTAKGFIFIVEYFRNFQLGISFLILFVILFFILKKWLNIGFIRGQKKLK